MSHPNIIAFEHCFEDDGNVYMQLELCANGVSLAPSLSLPASPRTRACKSWTNS